MRRTSRGGVRTMSPVQAHFMDVLNNLSRIKKLIFIQNTRLIWEDFKFEVCKDRTHDLRRFATLRASINESHVIENFTLPLRHGRSNLYMLASVSITPGSHSRSIRRQSLAFVHCKTIQLLRANIGGMDRCSAIGPGQFV